LARALASIARKSDGRRIFTDKFKREQIGRVRRGERTVAELGRELGIAPSLLQRWKRLMAPAGTAAGAARNRESPASAIEYIRELEVLLGKQTVQLEHLRAELETLRNGRRSSRR